MTVNRLLVVDDNQPFCEFIRKVAEGAGYEVEVVTHGAAFKERYGAFKPTTVMIDLMMADIDGIELVQWVAARKAPARVIVATGYSPEYASRAKMLGEGRGLDTVTTLIKPFKPARLRRILGEIKNQTAAAAGNGRDNVAERSAAPAHGDQAPSNCDQEWGRHEKSE